MKEKSNIVDRVSKENYRVQCLFKILKLKYKLIYLLLTLSQNSVINLLKRNYEATPLNLKSQLEKQINKF